MFGSGVDILAYALGFMSTPLVNSLLVCYAYWANVSTAAHVEGGLPARTLRDTSRLRGKSP